MSEHIKSQTYETRKEIFVARIIQERISNCHVQLENRGSDQDTTVFLRGKIAAYREFDEILSEASKIMNNE